GGRPRTAPRRLLRSVPRRRRPLEVAWHHLRPRSSHVRPVQRLRAGACAADRRAGLLAGGAQRLTGSSDGLVDVRLCVRAGNERGFELGGGAVDAALQEAAVEPSEALGVGAGGIEPGAYGAFVEEEGDHGCDALDDAGDACGFEGGAEARLEAGSEVFQLLVE